MSRYASRESLYGSFPVLGGSLSVLIGVLTLAGWQFRLAWLRAPFPTSPAITPWGALLFLLCGASLLLHFYGGRTSVAVQLARVASAIVVIHSGLVIVEYATGMNLGIDPLFMKERVLQDWSAPGPIGRYAFSAALAFFGTGLALLLSRKAIRGLWLNEALAGFVGLLSLLGLVGYVYGVKAFSGLGLRVQMALPGAVLFGALAVGTFFLYPHRGWARLFVGPEPAGIVTRRLLATSTIALVILGGLHQAIESAQVIDVEMGTALLVLANIVVFWVLTLTTARELKRLQEARGAAIEAMRESEERLRVATTAANMGIWVWDPNTGEVFWSEKTKALFGVDSDTTSFTYDFMMSRVHPEDRVALRKDEASALAPDGEYSNEYRLLRFNGESIWVAVRGRRLQDQDGKARVFGVIWDITDQKRAEQALIRSEKLASVGRMAATIAHEINNPLEAVINLIYLAKKDPTVSPQISSYLEIAEEELNRVAHIVRQTLGFYRDHSTAQSVSMSQIVGGVRELYSRRAQVKAVRVLERIQPGVPPVIGQPGELRQVFSNLVSNSIDALPESGTLHLRVRKIGESVRITVADNGVGIPDDARSRLFEPFFTTKESIGTGLGLWISKHIVEKHGGRIRLKSKPGRGTVFNVFLPAEITRMEQRLEVATLK